MNTEDKKITKSKSVELQNSRNPKFNEKVKATTKVSVSIITPPPPPPPPPLPPLPLTPSECNSSNSSRTGTLRSNKSQQSEGSRATITNINFFFFLQRRNRNYLLNYYV